MPAHSSTLSPDGTLLAGLGSVSGTFRKAEWRVRDGLPWEVRQIVQREHYSRDYGGGAVYRHVLFRVSDGWSARAYGAAIWHPAVYAIRRYGSLPLQLSRLVVDPSVPSNGASFLLAHSMRLIDRMKWPVLLTYADSAQGHRGQIYRATGWQTDGTGGGRVYIEPVTGRQLASIQDGHFIPCPDGWEERRSVKFRFIHAAAASSDAVGIQPDEDGSQPILPLQF